MQTKELKCQLGAQIASVDLEGTMVVVEELGVFLEELEVVDTVEGLFQITRRFWLLKMRLNLIEMEQEHFREFLILKNKAIENS